MDYNDNHNNHDEVLVGLYGDSSSDVYQERSPSGAPHYTTGYAASPQSRLYEDPTFHADYEDSWMPQPSSSSSSWWVRIAMQWLEAVTHPNLGMFVATLLILLAIYQFVHQQNRQLHELQHPPRQPRDWKTVLWQWLDQLRERDWLEWLQVQCVLLWDYAHFYSQMGMEMLRSLRLYWDTSILSTTVMTSEPWEDANEPQRQRNLYYRGARGNNLPAHAHYHQQQQLQQQQQQQQYQQKRNAAAGGVWSDLPELEDVVEYDHPLVPRHSNYYVSHEVEPAFLRPEDYPPGWLVYHTILGVVTKTEAEQYQLQIQQQQEQELQENHQLEQEEADAKSPTLSLPEPSPSPSNGSTVVCNHHDHNGAANYDGVHAESTKQHEPVVLPSITANG